MSILNTLKNFQVGPGEYVWRGECIVQTSSKRWEIQRADNSVVVRKSLTEAAAFVDQISGVKSSV